jgi:ComF family protein
MTLVKDFLSLIYPVCCEACGAELYNHEKHLCNLCRVSLPKSNFHIHDDNPVMRAFAGRFPLAHAFSYFIYEKSGKVQQLIHTIKYHGKKELAEYLGQLYGQELLQSGIAYYVDTVVPVPLHRNKLKARGFNQSEWFARGLATGLGKKLNVTALNRIRETSTQTRKKKFERWENVEGIFELTRPDEFKDSHVLLVDDVITTGATLEAAWQALQRAEGITISVASIAFASTALTPG